jgi:hypothetical protein
MIKNAIVAKNSLWWTPNSLRSWGQRRGLRGQEWAVIAGVVALLLFVAAGLIVTTWDAYNRNGIVAVIGEIVILLVVLACMFLMLHSDKIGRPVSAQMATPAPFERPSPRWGAVVASCDFEDYLRDQLSVALVVATTHPQAPYLEELLTYTAKLLADRYARHAVHVRLHLPAAWLAVCPGRTQADGTILYDDWLELRGWEQDCFEVIYQPFGEDITVVRMALR